jgi:predicted dehydrogenase
VIDGKVAIVGTGFMGPTHTEALRRIGVPVAGIMGSSLEKSVAAAKELGLDKAYGSYEEVLADAVVSTVHLCVPNVLHFPMAKAALEAGKHVMCEKPLAMNSAESAELVKIANGKNLAAGVCYNLRYYPINQQTRAAIRAGDIGKILHINGSYVQDWLLYDTDFNWRVVSSESGPLRAVSDIGTHWLDMVQSATGLKVEAVFADLQTFYPVRKRAKGSAETFSGRGSSTVDYDEVPIDTEDYGAILLRFEGGARGSLHVSQVCAGRKNAFRYEIAGSKAALAWDGERPNELWVGHRDKANEILMKDPSLMAPEAGQFASYPGGHAEGYPDSFKQCFQAFYSYIAAGDYSAKPGFPTFADGHIEIRLCDAILESARTEKWIKVESK